METIIVEINIAASDENTEFILPAHVKIDSLLPAIIRLVEQTHQELQYDPEHTMLCDPRSQKILPSNITLAQAGVRQGHQLMLV